MLLPKWNVPGSPSYNTGLPFDIILNSIRDLFLRGYWLAKLNDGHIAFFCTDMGVDGVSIDTDPDGIPVIVYGEETTELSFDTTTSTLRIETYS